jgi:hypothetical protein
MVSMATGIGCRAAKAISVAMRVSRYLPAYRIEGQKKDENGLFAKARQR